MFTPHSTTIFGNDMLQREANLWFKSHITTESLRECLSNVPPVKLLGTELLKTHRPQSGIFPTGVPRDQLKEAVTEIIAYTSRCATTTKQLSNLAPIPLTTICVEFGL